MRGDIWEAFQARFAIPQILEFYAATEGNFSLYNVEGKPGAIGRDAAAAGASLSGRDGPARCRDTARRCAAPTGSALPCARGEVGEAIGRIGTADEGGGRFEGYTDAGETEKKMLRDVFAKGDAWFRTGDLMRLDEQGFFYFVDRVGDTFRWKGENVATSEVNEAILQCPGVVDAATYGVAVPGADGRAGMAALVIDERFRSRRISPLISRAGCRPMRSPVVVAHLRRARHHRDLQAEETAIGARRFRSRPRAAIRCSFRDQRSGAYRSARCGGLCARSY